MQYFSSDGGSMYYYYIVCTYIISAQRLDSVLVFSSANAALLGHFQVQVQATLQALLRWSGGNIANTIQTNKRLFKWVSRLPLQKKPAAVASQIKFRCMQWKVVVRIYNQSKCFLDYEILGNAEIFLFSQSVVLKTSRSSHICARGHFSTKNRVLMR